MPTPRRRRKANTGGQPRRRRRRSTDDRSSQPDEQRDEVRPPRNPDADPVQIHRDYVERQLGGGASATRQAYDRAIEQWHQLPGAVRVPPTELTGDTAPPSATGEPEEGSPDGSRA